MSCHIRLRLQLDVVITDGSQPVGRGIGPVLEARDAMQVLNNLDTAPSDLRQKSLRLAGRILEFDPDVRGGYGFSLARDILDSGRALKKMQAIIKAQGKQTQNFQLGGLTKDITAGNPGFVVAINNFQLSKIARLAGAPMDKGAGVDLFVKLGDPVKADTVLYRIYAQFPADFDFACTLAQQGSGYQIGSEKQIPTAYVEL